MSDNFIKNISKRKDIFTQENSNNIPIVIICLIFAVITGLWLSTREILEVATDFFEKMPDERIAKIVKSMPEDSHTLEKEEHREWVEEEIKTEKRKLKPKKKKGAGGRTGGGGDPRARVTKKGVLGIISGAVKGKTVTASNSFGKGGYATGLDAVLSGSGGLKRGVNGGTGRKGEVSFGYGSSTLDKLGDENSFFDDELNESSLKDVRGVSRSVKEIRYEPRNFRNKSPKPVIENDFILTNENSTSTFSIDVDVASYVNARNYIKNQQLPTPSSIRIEEMINYFSYNYPFPKGKEPFSVITEIGDSPWNRKNRLFHIGIKGRKISKKSPNLNFVFLLDVSGSMTNANKLPLVKKSLKLLVNSLSRDDRIAIVTYAGEAGIALNSTPGNKKEVINNVIEGLKASGSTAGSEGLEVAYRIASQNFLEDGNNRVLLLTDGDFNIGPSNNKELSKLIKRRKTQEIFLTVLGFGISEESDERMENLAQEGDGNYAIIDDIHEAQRVLIDESKGTFFIVGKDVKVQVEFNPEVVESYRLIGYENRLLKKEDFANDKVDAGDIGSEQNVTALYEIVTTKNNYSFSSQNSKVFDLKIRYKEGENNSSELIVKEIHDSNKSLEMASDDFRFSASVAAFGMLLRRSKHISNYTFSSVFDLANSAVHGSSSAKRHEFLWMVRECDAIYQKRDLYSLVH